jgi:hypothetical protein
MTKVSDVLPFNGMLWAPKILVITGGATTRMVAVDGKLETPFEVTWTVFVCTPGEVPLTAMETLHPALARKLPPERLNDPEPGSPVAVPPQVLCKPEGVATTKPAGRLFTNETPFCATPELMSNVRLVVPFTGIVDAPKDGVIVIGGGRTVKVSVAEFPQPPVVDAIGILTLVNVPTAVPITLKLIEQLPLMGIVIPSIPKLDATVPVLTCPPHVFVRPLGFAMTSSEGPLSAKETSD